MREPSSDLWVCHLGVIPYADGVALQETLRERRLDGAIPDTLLLLEHPATYTRGRRSGAEDLPMPEGFYRERGIEVHATDRGGKLTYHGPGQLVGYPIMAVADVGRHLRTIEHAIVDALSEVGVAARSRHDEGVDYTGVWVGDAGADRASRRQPRASPREERPRTPSEAPLERGVGDRKIASIGVHISHGVSTHGFAINVDMDLDPFSWIVPCGLPDVEMTSIARELSPRRAPGVEEFRATVARSFSQSHGRRARIVSPQGLGLERTRQLVPA
ncbi:MAG TPA: lipoyl(octanoyl) transferase [Solirubrobacteraceae bacterium]|nr:lipoyl(octanoyl) transferase [Solirubrobacteraceae bacterium]